MMVHCPGCNSNYLVDERKVPRKGGTLTCRECGTRMRIGPPADHPHAAAAAPASPAAQAAPAATDLPRTSIVHSLPHLSDSSDTLQKPVSCPQCGHFFVPYAPRAAGAPSQAAKPPRPRGKVLLVEDQKYFAELTREALGQEFETTVTATASEARGLLTSGGYDLVILDLSLEEGQDGTLVLQATRRLGIPVLVFTARDETDLYSGVWDQLKAAGATDILIKGMNVGDELRQKVQSLLAVTRK